jgi:hypothetical protein
MDPLAAWVDLEPPLAAAGSRPAMAAAASQGATRVEGDATAGCETSPSCGKERSSMLLGTPSLSPIRLHLALVAARKREEGVKRTSALGFSGENRAPVLFELKICATVRSK